MRIIRNTEESIAIQNRSLETKHLVIPFGDGEGNHNRERQLLEDHLDSRFLSDVTMSYGPGGFCNLCGQIDYQCSDNTFGNWNNGERTFQDPLNTSVDSIRVEVFGYSCSSTPIEVSLNGNVLGTLASLSDVCKCETCYTSSGTFTINDPTLYNVGGSNTIKLRPTNGSTICVDRVELDLVPEPPQDLNCPSGQSKVVVTIDADLYREETSWDIVNDCTSAVVASGGNLKYNGVNTWPLCLPGGDYTFTIYDSYYDGLRHSDGSEFFAVSVDGVEQFKVDSDLDFFYSTSRDFTVTPSMPEPPSPCAGVNCGNAGKCQVTSSTTALCKCENTFVLSESGLECICPDGLDFHANVNRCLPPPTAAPTNLPTTSPTLTPTAAPTASAFEDEGPECIDDEFGTFKLVNVKEKVECSWLTSKKEKSKVRKKKHCGRDKVKRLCQSTCGSCTECDDKEGTFTLPNVNKKVACDWLTKNELHINTRIGTYCVDPKIRDMCKASCGACAVEDESGRV